MLNGICPTLDSDTDENKPDEIIKEYSGEIFDKEAYYVIRDLEKDKLLDKSSIIRIVGKDSEYTTNGMRILELMLR